MSSPAPTSLISSRPVEDWATIGARVAEAREAKGLKLSDVQQVVGIAPNDLLRLEVGEAVISMHEMKVLADLLDTTTGAWFYADQRPIFRGAAEDGAAREAEVVGRDLMMKFLAVEAVCG